MAQPDNFAKCACQHCGGHIEFPAEGVGRKIACPHCGEPTLLTHAAPVEIGGGCATRRRIYWTLGIAACLVALTGGALLYVNYRDSKLATAAPALPLPPPQTNPTVATTIPPPKPKPSRDLWHGLKPSKVTLDESGNSSLIYAIGTLTNETSRQRFGVKVEVEIFDEHRRKLGSATDYTDVIEPGKEWKFRAMVTDKAAKSAKLTNVKEQE
jgi:hypothetical protein